MLLVRGMVRGTQELLCGGVSGDDSSGDGDGGGCGDE